MLSAVALGLLVHELSQRPVPLPGVADTVAAIFNARQDTTRLQVGRVYLALTRRSRLPALRFADVSFADAATGEHVLGVRLMGARFAVPDLLQARIAPRGITVIEPTARLVRQADGRFRFGIGEGQRDDAAEDLGRRPGNALASEQPTTVPPTGEPDRGMTAVTTLLDGLNGIGPVPAGAERLRRVTIRDAALTLSNEATGNAIVAENATLRLRVTEAGLAATLDMPITSSAGEQTMLNLEGRRARGSRITDVRAEVGHVRLDGLAKEFPELAFLAPLAAPVAGDFDVVVEADGTLRDVSARLRAGSGGLRLGGPTEPPLPIRNAVLDLDYTPATGRLQVLDAAIDGDTGRLALTGNAWLSSDAQGLVTGVEVDLHARNLVFDASESLAEPVTFQHAFFAARADFAAERLELARVALLDEDLAIEASGAISYATAAPEIAVRARATGLDVDHVKALWPIGVGGNARPWFVQNLTQGEIPELIAQFAMAGERQTLALDFSFENVVSTYLPTMPAIEGGAGQAHLSLEQFDLALDEGYVDVPGAAPARLDLAGSSMTIYDFAAPQTPADIRLRGTGAIDAVLSVIDRPPLRLVSKLGLPLGRVEGSAAVEADLSFPLLAALKVSQVEAEARAALRDVALVMPLGVEGAEALPVTASALSLSANTVAMSLTGDIEARGLPLRIAWQERYGATPGRNLELAGEANAGLLADFGLPLDALGPEPFPVSLALEQGGDGVVTARLEADLSAPEISPSPLAWSKPAGSAARMQIDAAVRPADGEGTGADISGRFESGESVIAAEARIGTDGRLISANLDPVRLAPFADVTLAVEADGLGGYALALGGRRLDIALLDTAAVPEEEQGGSSEAEEGEGGPVGALRFDLNELVLTEGLRIEPVAGTLRREERQLSGEFRGRVNASAPASGTFALPRGTAEPEREPGALSLVTEDAGAFLRALGIAEEASGGRLSVEASLPSGGFSRLEGTVLATDLQVTEDSAVRRIVTRGGAEDALEADPSGGISFRDIVVPFAMADEVIMIDDAIATGPALAIRVGGRVDLAEETLDLSGVASPAYAVSGFLDDIPLLGRVLTGRRGEGLLGITFSVSGGLDEPDLSVNPLSILAPGILRNLFTGIDASKSADDEAASERDRTRLEDDFGGND
ncbi:MAG: AsmA-like C-terminal domain-containing protein [Pseudomonadota bacterium]